MLQVKSLMKNLWLVHYEVLMVGLCPDILENSHEFFNFRNNGESDESTKQQWQRKSKEMQRNREYVSATVKPAKSNINKTEQTMKGQYCVLHKYSSQNR